MDEKIIIVDEKDQIIGTELRNIVRKKNLRYRVSALWIINSKKENLLAKRAYTKKQHPGKWGPAAAGTVAEGESYEQNILKEAEEELGLKNIKVEKIKKVEGEGEYKHFTQLFISKINKQINNFKIQKEEVAKIKWFSTDKLENLIQSNPEKFTPTMKKYLNLIKNKL